MCVIVEAALPERTIPTRQPIHTDGGESGHGGDHIREFAVSQPKHLMEVVGHHDIGQALGTSRLVRPLETIDDDIRSIVTSQRLERILDNG